MRVSSRLLLRAPLWPVRAPLHPWKTDLGRAALALAGKSALVDEHDDDRAARALAGYATRARTRSTPHGLWAGVAVAELGASTKIATGTPRAHLTVSWARLASLGRALLEDPAVLVQARFRRAPSLVVGSDSLQWLTFGDDAVAVWQSAARDDLLDALVTAAADWVPRSALAVDDDLLYELVDDRLLLHDLEPPLVGEAPFAWMRGRLAELGVAFDELARALEAGDVVAAERLLSLLPGVGPRPLQGVLVHQPRRPPTVARSVVERAAGLAPLLFRLQDALVPPAAERALDGELHAQLHATAELYGAGGYDLGAFVDGAYGLGPAGADLPRADAATVAWLTDALLYVERAGDHELSLEPAALDALLPAGRPPKTFEVILAPVAGRRGDGWMLGLHAPAGSSWGRYAGALGEPFVDVLRELAATEPPGAVDVAYTPTAELADLTAHPSVRPGCLALSSWPYSSKQLTIDSLTLGIEPAAHDALSLWHGGQPVRPSPLHRLRSTTAPPGVPQLLVGFELYRQHAPWALSLGPLADLTRLPRITVDGFVVAPRSWRIPSLATMRELKAWARELDVPSEIQLGHKDELLVVDLHTDETLERLQRAHATDERARVFEVWPPLGAEIDEDGRRIELCALVCSEPSLMPAAPALVPPPRAAEPSAFHGWKIFGAPDRAERVLSSLAPLLTGPDAMIDGWFYLRYVEGARHHIRLRASGNHAAFARALDEALADSRARGDVTIVESGPYVPERGRYGSSLAAVERLFCIDSAHALQLLQEEGSADNTLLVADAFDALATGAGLDLAARHQLAVDLRAANQPELDLLDDKALAAEHRARSRTLVERLTSTSQRRQTYIEAVSTVGDIASLLPVLLHLAANRLAGVDRTVELRALYLWGRALEGLRARRR